MPMLSRIGRTTLSARLLLAGIYFVLAAGGITMLYPFLLMVATSVTGDTDYREYRLVPPYFYDREARFTKFIAEKYQQASAYTALHGGSYLSLKDVGKPVYAGDPHPPVAPRVDRLTGAELPPRPRLDTDFARIERRVALWRAFKQELPPNDFGVWHVGRRAMPGRAEMLWRDRLRKLYGDDIRALNRDLGKDLLAFTEGFAPFEKPEGRLWPGVSGNEGRLWSEFKAGLDPRYRRAVDGVALWRSYLKFKYRRLEEMNAELGTTFADWREVPFPRTAEDAARAALLADWEHMLRSELPYRFVGVRDGDEQYRRFLSEKYGTPAAINRQLGTAYFAVKYIAWPPSQPTAAELDAVGVFLRTAGNVEDLSVRTPDMAYGDSLKRIFGGDLERLNREMGTRYASFEDVRPPYDEEDVWEFETDQAAWMNWYLTRNYSEVVDYIAIRGRALWNTVFFVAIMIVCSLTINPLAAYALSRFRLGYTNRILLFLLATMAFPYEVTMIPNFLLLRRFPLWQGLIGLAAGLLVAYIVLRRTKGIRRVAAIPAGIGTAVLAGFYVVPALAGWVGIEVGSVSLLNTFAALILPRMAGGYSIFLLKGFFDSLPDDLFEAATIDGASELRIMWQVAFPLSTPVLAVMALQTFTATYSSYLWALVVCQSDRMWTLMVYIFQLQQWAPTYVTMAATVLASIPTLLVFILAQNTIMRGIVVPVEK